MLFPSGFVMFRSVRLLALALLTLGVTACGDEDTGYSIDASVSDTTLSATGADTTQIFVTILDSKGNPAPVATPVTMFCISTATGGPFGITGGQQSGLGSAETGLVGDAVLTFSCEDTPGLVVCTVSADIGGGVSAQADPITCE